MSYEFKTVIANKSNYGKIRDLSAIKYIVVHYTGNDGDTAEQNAKYFQNNIVSASAHYFIDDDSVTQSVPDNYVAWSVGGSKYADCNRTGGGTYYGKCANSNSISVELCDTQKDGVSNFSEKTTNNAVELIKLLMTKFSVDIDHVIRHFDVTGKTCPKPFIDNSTWNDFKNRLGDNEMTAEEKAKMQAIDDSLTNLYKIVQEIKNENPTYNTLDDIPDWGKIAVQTAINKGAITGDGNALNITYHDLRAIVREYRMGLYD